MLQPDSPFKKMKDKVIVTFLDNLQNKSCISHSFSQNIFSLCYTGRQIYYLVNRISGVMVNMLASNVVGFGFEHWSGQTKD